MKTIRFGTFETNSSSCHSITIFENRKDWDDFKNNKTYINRGMYDMEEHAERVNIISDENRSEYIVDINDLYERVKEEIEERAVPLCSSRYHRYDEKDDYIINYLKDHFDFDLMLKILTGKGNEIVCNLEKPITIKSYYEDRYYVYNDLTISDFYDFIFGYGCLSENLPSFYVYGDGGDAGWTNAEVKEFVEKNTGEEFVVVVRDEEC